jgi:hypothetical protein
VTFLHRVQGAARASADGEGGAVPAPSRRREGPSVELRRLRRNPVAARSGAGASAGCEGGRQPGLLSAGLDPSFPGVGEGSWGGRGLEWYPRRFRRPYRRKREAETHEGKRKRCALAFPADGGSSISSGRIRMRRDRLAPNPRADGFPADTPGRLPEEPVCLEHGSRPCPMGTGLSRARTPPFGEGWFPWPSLRGRTGRMSQGEGFPLQT